MSGFYSIENWPREIPRTGKSVLQILMERDIALVAGGALGCVRSIYNVCRNMRCLDRLIPCFISNREYALGICGRKIEAAINKALSKKVSAVVIYVSCSEFLMGIDYQDVISRVNNPENIPIHVFFRGPLCARRINMGENARKLAEMYSYAKKESYGEDCPELPHPDYAGVKELSDYFGYESILLNAGGCTGCMSDLKPGRTMLSTRFDDIFASTGNWDDLIELVGKNTKKDTHYTVMKAAILSILMTGTEDLSPITDAEHLHVAKTGSWDTESDGISEFLCDEVKRWAEKKDPENRTGLVVLGWPAGDHELWTPKVETLPERCLVISKEGLKAATYLKESFGIPFTEC